MDKYVVLLGYWEKQLDVISRLYDEIIKIDLSSHDPRYVFALKVQQIYSAIEDLLKQVAKAFENNIDDFGSFHKEILLRLYTEMPKVRPALLSKKSFKLLDEIRKFRHFIRHAYDCELEQTELEKIRYILQNEFSYLEKDFEQFHAYVTKLAAC